MLDIGTEFEIVYLLDIGTEFGAVYLLDIGTVIGTVYLLDIATLFGAVYLLNFGDFGTEFGIRASRDSRSISDLHNSLLQTTHCQNAIF